MLWKLGYKYIFIYLIFYYIYFLNIHGIKYLILNQLYLDTKLITRLLIKIVDQATKIIKIYRPGNVRTEKKYWQSNLTAKFPTAKLPTAKCAN